MKFQHLLPSLLAVTACTLAASPTLQADDSGFYVGAAGGASTSQLKTDQMTKPFLAAGQTLATMSHANRSVGYKAYLGYQFNRYISLEGGYFNLGKFNFTSGAATPAGTLNAKTKANGGNLDLVLGVPLSETFSLYGRLGGTYTKTQSDFTGTGGIPAITTPKNSEKVWGEKLGLGMQYLITPALRLRTEAERYHIGDGLGNKGYVALYSLGLAYQFGVEDEAPKAMPVVVEKPKPAPVAKPAPQPVITMPKPQPVVKVEPKKVVFSDTSTSNSLFAFGKSILSDSGKASLDRFAGELNGADYGTIKVIGHTDRIGSKKANQRLSEKRANVVRDYLVNQAGIPASKVVANGMGEEQPVTDCKGKARTKALIDCLAPDRRVELEVMVTRTEYR